MSIFETEYERRSASSDPMGSIYQWKIDTERRESGAFALSPAVWHGDATAVAMRGVVCFSEAICVDVIVQQTPRGQSSELIPHLVQDSFSDRLDPGKLWLGIRENGTLYTAWLDPADRVAQESRGGTQVRGQFGLWYRLEHVPLDLKLVVEWRDRGIAYQELPLDSDELREAAHRSAALA
jgi:hypothetical protein